MTIRDKAVSVVLALSLLLGLGLLAIGSLVAAVFLISEVLGSGGLIPAMVLIFLFFIMGPILFRRVSSWVAAAMHKHLVVDVKQAETPAEGGGGHRLRSIVGTLGVMATAAIVIGSGYVACIGLINAPFGQPGVPALTGLVVFLATLVLSPHFASLFINALKRQWPLPQDRSR